MSVLIKGMLMPKNCAECPVALSGKYCRINQTCTTYIKLPIRPHHCPLVELQDKHGRLVDADALMDIFADRLLKLPGKYGINSAVAGAISGAMKLLDVQPTVIEAEGEE